MSSDLPEEKPYPIFIFHIITTKKHFPRVSTLYQAIDWINPVSYSEIKLHSHSLGIHTTPHILNPRRSFVIFVDKTQELVTNVEHQRLASKTISKELKQEIDGDKK